MFHNFFSKVVPIMK